MKPTSNLQTTLTESQWAILEPLINDFEKRLRSNDQPNIGVFVARVDASLQDKLREELVGEEFAYQFGDATQNGKLRYRPIATLGKGAFGEVYKAVDEELNRNVAIKVLLRTEDSAKQRFLAEARRQANLPKHNHLVGVYDSGTLPKGHPFIVMEYVDGGTLRERLRTAGTLDAATAARLVEQIALAVDAVHAGTSGSRAHPSQPLVHRDLKPENILLDRLDNASVADFGLAAALADLHDGGAGAGGTFDYMSPEQATAFRPGMTAAPVDTRTDVWAVGIILYELLTGMQPFVSTHTDPHARRDEILNAIIHYEHPRLKDFSREVPSELETLVERCLKKDVSKRIQTVSEVAHQLRHWLDSVSAMPVPLDFAARLAEARKDFSDRPWLFDEVDAWRVHQHERLLVLTGELGCGKSAFLAELIHRNSEKRILAWHLCRHDWPESRSAAWFVRSLAGMLAQRVESYRSKLADLHLREALRIENCDKDPVSAFERAVATPLRECSPPGDDVWFVVVDALDEADRSESPSIPDLVAQWARRLPSWLRIIVSVRRDALEPNPIAGHQHLAFDRDNTHRAGDIRDDIQRFLRQRLAEPNLAERLQQSRVDAQATTSTLIQKSEANYLYIAEALVAIERDKITFTELGKLPPGLTALYDSFFRRLWPNELSFANVRPVLEVLIAAREPMLEDLVSAATALDVYKLKDRLNSLQQFLAECPNPLRLRHQALADWLAATSGMFRVERKEGHKKLAAACWKQYQDDVGSMSEYALRHLPHHLAEAGRWDDLHTVLMDIDYLQAKADKGYVVDLLTDYGRVVGDMRKKSRPEREVIGLVARALRFDLSFVTAHPSTLFQSLYNRCWWHGGTLQQLLEDWHRKQSGRPWIRSLQPPAESFGGIVQTRLIGHESPVVDVSLARDNVHAATGSVDGTIRVWNLETSACVTTLCVPAGDLQNKLKDEVTRVRFSPVGEQLAAMYKGDMRVRIWDWRTARVVNELRAYSPKWVEVTNGETRELSERGYRSFHRLAFSHDGKLLAGALMQYFVAIWDLNSGKQTHVLNIQYTDIAFSKDGLLAISKQYPSKKGKGIIELYPISDLAALPMKLICPLGPASCVAFSKDGKRLAAATSSGVAVWDLADNKKPTELKCEQEDWDSIRFLSNTRLACGAMSGRILAIWDISKEIQILPAIRQTSGRSPTAIEVTSNGDKAIVSSGDNFADVVSLESIPSDPSISNDQHDWSAMESIELQGYRYLANGKFLSGGKNSVLVWDPEDGRIAHRLIENAVSGNPWFPCKIETANGETIRVAAACKDSEIRVWNIEQTSENELAPFWHKSAPIMDADNNSNTSGQKVALSGNGKWLATSRSGSSFVHVAELDRGEWVTQFALPPTQLVFTLAISHDGAFAAICSHHGTIYLWNVTTGKGVWRNAFLDNCSCKLHSVLFSNDSKWLAAGTENGAICVWNLEDLHLERRPAMFVLSKQHTRPVKNLLFSDDSSFLATGSDDNMVCIWNIQNKNFVRKMNARIPDQTMFDRHRANLWECREENDNTLLTRQDGTTLRIPGTPSLFKNPTNDSLWAGVNTGGKPVFLRIQEDLCE